MSNSRVFNDSMRQQLQAILSNVKLKEGRDSKAQVTNNPKKIAPKPKGFLVTHSAYKEEH